MADEALVAKSDEAFKAFMDGYADADDFADDPEVPAEEDPLAIAKQTQAQVQSMANRDRVRELREEFEKVADDDTKIIFATLSEGIEDPEKLRGLMQIAKDKADALKPAPTESDDEVERLAEEKAQSAYGVAPVRGTGSVDNGPTPEEVYDDLSAKARAGDSHAAFLLWRNLPEEAPASKE